ncbi:MAG: Acetyltransferase (GNAT) family protein [Methanomassiliicoccales archaeon PtaU1.Bin124]|nr:MAG: Acetyltransferase (GNAT) family protein [Methanomassiliicoccales archaeon PtaU1.Bin124]
MLVRDARLDDSEAINDIYNHYVPVSNCTMETEPVSIETRRIWFLEHGERFPVMVCEDDGQVVGWASISPHRIRAAYRYTVEDAVYVREDKRGKGVGGALLDKMIPRCQELGYHSIVAVINASQSPSLALHASRGFVEVAHLRQVGFKLGRWQDIKYMQRIIGSE